MSSSFQFSSSLILKSLFDAGVTTTDFIFSGKSSRASSKYFLILRRSTSLSEKSNYISRKLCRILLFVRSFPHLCISRSSIASFTLTSTCDTFKSSTCHKIIDFFPLKISFTTHRLCRFSLYPHFNTCADRFFPKRLILHARFHT